MENEGIEYLRTYLHLPSEIVPSTLKRATRSEPARARPSAPTRSGDASKTGEDRSAYRRAPGSANAEKKADVGAGAVDVEFVSFVSNHQQAQLISFHVHLFVCLSVFFPAWWIRSWIKTSIDDL